MPGQHDAATSDSGEPTLKSRQQISIEDGAAHLQQQVRASLSPTHLLGLAHSTPDQSIHGSFNSTG
jgi:hypothetical protein